MAKVDLSLIRFDFDLTLAILLMHADGTIYHRYGSRGPDSADGYLSLASLARLLRATVREHRAYDRNPSPPRLDLPRPAIELPALQKKIVAGQAMDCVHCHMINDAEHEVAVKQRSWSPRRVYVYPDPERIGISLDGDNQRLITAVAARSAAATAGLRVGDELTRLGVQRSVRTLGDVQWALHDANIHAGTRKLAVRYLRNGRELAGTIALRPGWMVADPRDYAWRPYKYNLSPAPGFGGPMLDARDKAKIGLAADKFAMRVQYIVTWGPRAHRGRAARKAGLRKGDIVLSFAGVDDFVSVTHFHAWVRLTRKAGEKVEFVTLRGGKRKTMRYVLPR